MSWTLSELTAEVGRHMASLPAPSNGQVRAVPDERNIRYYTTLGLLDRPLAMRGRTALYGPRHAAQVVAIKRLQAAGKSLSEITALWPTLDVATLERVSGIVIAAVVSTAAAVAPTAPPRRQFWKQAAAADVAASVPAPVPVLSAESAAPTQLPASVTTAPKSTASVVVESTTTIALTESIRLLLPSSQAPADFDLDRLMAAAAPLLAELARQRASSREP
ncbi:MAG TPA: MerR family transcriptional regulator [Kofleriaceae bacterium]|nr:MerR family transcriptional regulator [Kofleriaceae bacterium]